MTPSSGEEYIKAIQRVSELSVLHPKYVVFPTVFEDIPHIIKFATSQSLEIAVKGGGANTSAWSSTEGGLVIDLGKLKAVQVSDDKKTMTVQGGALWGDVYEVCKKAEIDVVGAPYWFLGVGGFLLGGGFGVMSGEHGFAVDSILGATVVLADGRIVKTSATEEPDLFWAIRGGLNQFGIVVEFVLKAYPPQGPFSTGSLGYSENEVSNIVNAFYKWQKSKNTEYVCLAFARPPPHFQPTILITYFLSHGDDAAKTLAPFRNAAKPILDRVEVSTDMLTVCYARSAEILSGTDTCRMNLRGALVSEAWPDLVLDTWNRWRQFTEDDSVKQTFVVWNATKADKDTSAGSNDTAVPDHLKSQYWMLVNGRSQSPTSDDAMLSFVSSTVEYVRKVNIEKSGRDTGIFVNLSRGDEDQKDIFGANLPRLRKLKAKYDPEVIWSKAHVIEPDFS